MSTLAVIKTYFYQNTFFSKEIQKVILKKKKKKHLTVECWQLIQILFKSAGSQTELKLSPQQPVILEWKDPEGPSQ